MKPDFFKLIAEAKKILSQILFLTDEEIKELKKIGSNYPYDNRIKKCSECIEKLNENLVKEEVESETEQEIDVEMETPSEQGARQEEKMDINK